MCLKYCMRSRECQKYGVLSNRQLIKFYLWYEDFQPYNEGFPSFLIIFFFFFNPGQSMADEVTERAGWLAHPFRFPRFNGKERTAGWSHPSLTPPPTPHVDSPPGPLTRYWLVLISITGMTSPFLSFQPHFLTHPPQHFPQTREASSHLRWHLPQIHPNWGQADASLGCYWAQRYS